MPQPQTIPVLHHVLCTPPMASAVRAAFASAASGITHAVSLNPGLASYYLVRLSAAELGLTDASQNATLCALFVESSRLPAAALWAGELAASGVLIGKSGGELSQGAKSASAPAKSGAQAPAKRRFPNDENNEKQRATGEASLLRRAPYSNLLALRTFSGSVEIAREGFVFLLDAAPWLGWGKSAPASRDDKNDKDGGNDRDNRNNEGGSNNEAGVGKDCRETRESPDLPLPRGPSLSQMLSEFLWIAAVQKIAQKIAREEPAPSPRGTMTERFMARHEGRFPTLSRKVLTPETAAALEGAMPPEAIGRYRQMTQGAFIVEHEALIEEVELLRGLIAREGGMAMNCKSRARGKARGTHRLRHLPYGRGKNERP